jgi:ubiquinone/menaquinone biosynthesis C-methylase UbiE
MHVLFNEKIARTYDRWVRTSQGRKAYKLEGELIFRLGNLTCGQRLLEVGCGTGAHLEIFRGGGLNVSGLDVSSHMLWIARGRLGENAQLCVGDAENLPFKGRSFDSVALIATLEFISNPRGAIQEALRVSRGKVLLGVLNRLSFLGFARRLKARFHPTIYNRARFYSIWELRRLIADAVPEGIVQWASVLVLPIFWQNRFPKLEKRLSFRRNPLGAFLGLAVSVKEAHHEDIRPNQLVSSETTKALTGD